MAMPIEEAYAWVNTHTSGWGNLKQFEEIVTGLNQRLEFVDEVGLGYLNLEREYRSLSGGESQRVRLATQLGMGLVGVIYVLDEPSIGLHPYDNGKLIQTLISLLLTLLLIYQTLLLLCLWSTKAATLLEPLQL